MSNKIKIAFVKFAGLASGGSEKLLQTIAAHLPKDEFEVSYFYCDAAPFLGEPTLKHGDTDPYRLAYLEEHGVTVHKFFVEAVDARKPTRPWVGTNFFEKFDEDDYDIIQTCRAGHKEYPFTKIRRTPIVDIVALSSGSDNQYNIARVMHICQWSAERWVKRGGDAQRIELISLPISLPSLPRESLRSRLGLEQRFIFGFHQRPSDDIFSEIPLQAYKQIESERTAFILLGGSQKYQEQARDLHIRSMHFLPPTGNQDEIDKFLGALDVYAHGRKDGEVNSQAMGEAMGMGLPIVSHISTVNNGHIECIGEAGQVVGSVQEYASELLRLEQDQEYYMFRSQKSRERFQNKYELQGQINRIATIYHSVKANPFPHPFVRLYTSLHYTQNIRVYMVKVYLWVKYNLNIDLLKIFGFLKRND